jgi:hypothetical protein
MSSRNTVGTAVTNATSRPSAFSVHAPRQIDGGGRRAVLIEHRGKSPRGQRGANVRPPKATASRLFSFSDRGAGLISRNSMRHSRGMRWAYSETGIDQAGILYQPPRYKISSTHKRQDRAARRHAGL